MKHELVQPLSGRLLVVNVCQLAGLREGTQGFICYLAWTALEVGVVGFRAYWCRRVVWRCVRRVRLSSNVGTLGRTGISNLNRTVCLASTPVVTIRISFLGEFVNCQ